MSNNIKTGFEKELKLRLAQKAKPNQPEDVLLIKAMKYFDLNNSGTVSKDEFFNAMQRLGINSFEKSQLQQLFEIYDVDKSGELDYKEFTSILFGTPRSPTKVGKRPPTAVSESESPAIKPYVAETQVQFDDPVVVQSLNTLKEVLNNRGTSGIVGFARMFRVADDNNNKKIEFEEFYKAMKDFQVNLTLVQVQKLFSFFDKDRTGFIDYDELLFGLRGQLNSFRKGFVDKAFNKLDKNGDGQIDISDLKDVYYVNRHPDVVSGKKSEQEIYEEFLHTFESYSFYKGKLDNVVTHQEFEDYYSFISASIDDDQYFATMMNNGWKLDQNSSARPEEEEKNDQKLVVNDYEQLQGNIGFMIRRLRQRLIPRGLKAFVVIHKIIRDIDADRDGVITQKELLKALKDNRLEITEQDAQAILEYYDTEKKGAIPVEAFLTDLLGGYSASRREILDLAWNNLKGSAENKVDVGTLKDSFKNLRNHPDVKSGRKTDIQVNEEYNEGWDIYRMSVSKVTTDHLTRQEFDGFFLCLSATIEDDKVFDLVIQQTFKLRPETAQKNWAGMTGGRNDYDPKASYVQDFHRSLNQGGSVASKAPFGTSGSHGNPYQEPPQKEAPKRNVRTEEESRPTTRGGEQKPTGNVLSPGLGEKELFEYLRKKIVARGTRGILGIARMFKNIDDDNSGTLSFQEFDKGLKDFRIDVVEEDALKIFSYLDTNKNGSIDYDEFLRMVRGEMNDNRKKSVIEVFERLDKDKNGFLTIDDIRELYSAKQHPDVKTGKKEEDDVLMEFLETFEQHHAARTNNKGKDKKVSLDEFIEYYNHISCSIDDDRYFELMISNSWNSNRNYKKGWKADQ